MNRRPRRHNTTGSRDPARRVTNCRPTRHTLPHPPPFIGSLRRVGADPAQSAAERGRYAATRGGRRRDPTFDTPLPAIDTP